MITLATGMLVVLGPWGCVGNNPEWDAGTSATDGPPSRSELPRCNDAADGTGAGGDTGEESSGTGEPPCRVAEADVCGDTGLVACESDREWFCVDPIKHDEHCGSCFNDCAQYGEASCVDGECYCKGGPWWKLCAEGCADTREDPAGCGIQCVDCREIYGPQARCETGVCAPAGGGDRNDDDDDDDD